MNLLILYYLVLTLLFVTAPIVFIYLFFYSAPYGRHSKVTSLFTISSQIGWFIMELPAVIIMCYLFLVNPTQLVAWIFFLLWQIHYLNRAFIFPLRLSKSKPMPISIPLLGAFFNILNGYVNGFSLTHTLYELSWLFDIRFIIGTLLFLTGFIINQHSDFILLSLRQSQTDYQVPKGGLFKWISCPNYLGEIIEWLGWAIATWSLAGFAFALWTMANLVPRAYTHHKWYQLNFPNYPQKRRALI